MITLTALIIFNGEVLKEKSQYQICLYLHILNKTLEFPVFFYKTKCSLFYFRRLFRFIEFHLYVLNTNSIYKDFFNGSFPRKKKYFFKLKAMAKFEVF